MSAATLEHCCSYVLDRTDQLVAVDRGWTRFAHENNGASVIPERVLRTSIWEHVIGLENRMVYQRVLDRVRKHRQPIQFALRCDSPTCERHLEMRVEFLEEGDCLFSTSLTKCVERPRLDLFDPRAPRTDDSLAICGWCMQLDVLDIRWHSAEEALLVLGLPRCGPMPKLVHTICPECLDRLDQALENQGRPDSSPS